MLGIGNMDFCFLLHYRFHMHMIQIMRLFLIFVLLIMGIDTQNFDNPIQVKNRWITEKRFCLSLKFPITTIIKI